jgi:hypothetical protein
MTREVQTTDAEAFASGVVLGDLDGRELNSVVGQDRTQRWDDLIYFGPRVHESVQGRYYNLFRELPHVKLSKRYPCISNP